MLQFKGFFFLLGITAKLCQFGISTVSGFAQFRAQVAYFEEEPDVGNSLQHDFFWLQE
jgi:hypothetical protein